MFSQMLKCLNCDLYQTIQTIYYLKSSAILKITILKSRNFINLHVIYMKKITTDKCKYVNTFNCELILLLHLWRKYINSNKIWLIGVFQRFIVSK